MTAPTTLSAARHEWIRAFRLHEKAALVAEIVHAHIRVRRMLARADLPAVLAGLRAGRVPASRYADPLAEKAAAIRLGRAIARTLLFVPGDSRCLVRSLVLVSLLARRGVDVTLVIGVSPGPDFHAHAWVESDGFPVLPSLDDVHERIVEL